MFQGFCRLERVWNREFYHFGVCGGGLRGGGLRGGGLRGGGLRGGGLRGGGLRGGSLRSDENLRSFRQAKILVTARGATFFVHRLGIQ